MTAPGRWRTKAAAQLPREWLEFENVVILTNTPKLAQEHDPDIVRCPSFRIAPFAFSWSVGKVGLEKY